MIKKIGLFLWVVILTVSIVFIQNNALADAVISDGGKIGLTAGGNGKGDDTDGTLVRLSTNVSAAYNTNDTGSNATSFSAVTVNSQGTQKYGAASDVSKIYYKDVGTGESATKEDVTNGDSQDITGSDWSVVGE